jgi:hypothetical protein
MGRKRSFYQINIKSIFIILCLIVFVLINLTGHRFVDRYSMKLDLTENALYEFSEITKNAARSLNTPISITVLNREEDYVVMLREVLKRYSSLSDFISLKFVDPFDNPVLAASYADRGIQIHTDDIVIEGSARTKVFSIEDMYTLNTGRTDITGLNAEQQLTSALYFINNPEVPAAAFVDGHNERPSTALKELFTRNNFELLRGTMSSLDRENPDILVIASPSRDFLPEDIEHLNLYMNRGGNIFLFIEPSAEPFPLLEGFLAEWGIIPGNELVFEEKANTANNPVNIVPMYDPHIINRYFMETRIFLTMPSSRSLHKVAHQGSAYKVQSILSSTSDSYGKQGYQFDQLTREAGDIDGPFSLVMSSEKKLANGDISRLVVVGSRKIYGDDLLGFSSYGNSEFLVQTINWLNKEDTSVNIPSKKIQLDPLNIQFGQTVILGFLLCVLIPLGFLITGIIMFLRRKSL